MAEQAIVPPVVTSTSTPKRRPKRRTKGPSHQKRNESYREVKGIETMKAYKEKIDDELFAGFGEVAEFLQKLDLSVQDQIVAKTISTRGIGFMLGMMMEHISAHFERPVPGMNVHAFYRATLLQLSVQLHESQAIEAPTMDTSFRVEEITSDVIQLVKSKPINFSPVAGVVNAIGSFEHKDVKYVPYVPRGRDVPPFDPRFIGIDNLRVTVEGLSNIITPVETRNAFHDFSAIPGAEWMQDPNHGWLIANADEIIPPLYGLQQMRADFDTLSVGLRNVSRKFPRYYGKIEFDGRGSPAILISSQLTQCRIETLVDGDRRFLSKVFVPSQPYWSGNRCTRTQFALGVLLLCGEVDNHYRRGRCKYSAEQSAHYNWSTIVGSMMC